MIRIVGKYIISFFILSISLLPAFSNAQTDLNLPFEFSNELNVEISPSYPKSFETVSVSLKLYTDDLNIADISWYKDGKLVKSGKGLAQFSFVTGEIGESTNIEARIRLSGGALLSKNFTIIPNEINLVWESNSYVPPFYKGKALHSKQGLLKIVAIPHFKKNGRYISPSSLIYEWSNRNSVYQNQSGYGKNVLVLEGSILGKTESIDVIVTDPVNNLVSAEHIDITPTNPEILFYQNDPYYGHIFDSAIKNAFELGGDEVQVLAVPYFFSKETLGSLKYSWRLNGKGVPELSESRSTIFRKPEESSGQSLVSLSIENPSRILQQASAGLNIRFAE